MHCVRRGRGRNIPEWLNTVMDMQFHRMDFRKAVNRVESQYNPDQEVYASRVPSPTLFGHVRTKRSQYNLDQIPHPVL